MNASDGASSDNKALHWAVTYGNTDIVKLLCGKFLFFLYMLLLLCCGDLSLWLILQTTNIQSKRLP